MCNYLEPMEITYHMETQTQQKQTIVFENLLEKKSYQNSGVTDLPTYDLRTKSETKQNKNRKINKARKEMFGSTVTFHRL